MAKRATLMTSNLQYALINQVGVDTASAVQETALATKALLQAALQPTSEVTLLKACRLAAVNVICVRISCFLANALLITSTTAHA